MEFKVQMIKGKKYWKEGNSPVEAAFSREFLAKLAFAGMSDRGRKVNFWGTWSLFIFLSTPPFLYNLHQLVNPHAYCLVIYHAV